MDDDPVPEEDDSAETEAPAPKRLSVMMTMAGREGGGAESFFARLAGGLTRREVEVSAVVRPHPPLLASLAAAGVKPETAPFRARLDLKTRTLMKRKLATEQPDVVLAFMQRAAALTPKGPYRLVGRLGGPYPLGRFRHCDHLIAPAPHLVEAIVEAGWPRDRVSLLPNFLRDRAEERRPPPGLPRPDTGSLVLGLGRFHQVKGFDTLIQALAAVPNATLWMVGSGPEEVSLRHLAGSLNLTARIRFLGWQDDPLPLLRMADLLVVPSREEPFGNVVLEGWMAGCPVLASASAGPSWLIEDGRSGVLFKPGNPALLAAAMRSLLAEPALRGDLAEGGREAYLAGFSEDQGIDAYLAFFDRLCAASAKQA
ncbi:MAG: glycosyltransferase [Kiloniellales bacterium]